MANVLILDDSPDLRLALKAAVELDGHIVQTARNGAEGLSLLDGGTFAVDVVVCDLRMAELGGLEFMTRVRADARFSHLFIIAISGNQHDRAEALASGANIYLPKPFSLLALNQLIATHSSRP